MYEAPIGGLAAAGKVHWSGQGEMCALEASERVGGRVQIGANQVGSGAAWIHRTIGNPAFNLACGLKLLSRGGTNKEWVNEIN